MELQHFLILHTKLNSKGIKDLNNRPETRKLLEDRQEMHKSYLLFFLISKAKEIKRKKGPN